MRTLSPHAYRRPRGMTLIELIIVVVILSIAAGVAVVRLDSLVPSARMDAALHQITSDLELARSNAALKGLVYGVEYDLNENTYAILIPTSEALDYERDSDRSDRIDRRMPLWKELPEDIELKTVQVWGQAERNNGRATIDFTPMGTASGHTVRLRNERDEREAILELNPLSGLVSIYNGDYEFDGVVEYRD